MILFSKSVVNLKSKCKRFIPLSTERNTKNYESFRRSLSTVRKAFEYIQYTYYLFRFENQSLKIVHYIFS